MKQRTNATFHSLIFVLHLQIVNAPVQHNKNKKVVLRAWVGSALAQVFDELRGVVSCLLQLLPQHTQLALDGCHLLQALLLGVAVGGAAVLLRCRCRCVCTRLNEHRQLLK